MPVVIGTENNPFNDPLDFPAGRIEFPAHYFPKNILSENCGICSKEECLGEYYRSDIWTAGHGLGSRFGKVGEDFFTGAISICLQTLTG
jgi:hypothetical protein